MVHLFSRYRARLARLFEGEPAHANRTANGWPDSARQFLACVAFVTAFGLGVLAVLPGQASRRKTAAPRLQVELNSAPASVLGALPGVGPALVNRVLDARERAPIVSLADARGKIAGLGPVTIGQLRSHLRQPDQSIVREQVANLPGPRSRRMRRSKATSRVAVETALATPGSDR